MNTETINENYLKDLLNSQLQTDANGQLEVIKKGKSKVFLHYQQVMYFNSIRELLKLELLNGKLVTTEELVKHDMKEVNLEDYQDHPMYPIKQISKIQVANEQEKDTLSKNSQKDMVLRIIDLLKYLITEYNKYYSITPDANTKGVGVIVNGEMGFYINMLSNIIITTMSQTEQGKKALTRVQEVIDKIQKGELDPATVSFNEHELMILYMTQLRVDYYLNGEKKKIDKEDFLKIQHEGKLNIDKVMEVFE